MFHKGRWAAIFQATEKGMQQLLKRAKPKSIMDLAALSAIYRPGPLTAGVDKAYVRDKSLVESGGKIEYDHPAIERVLSKTYGHMCFQEDFMLLGKEFGLSWEDCDKLRKILVKKSTGTDVNEKKRAEAERIRNEFTRGALERGLSREKIDELWEKMVYFSGYGFNLCLADNTLVDVYTRDGTYVETKMIRDIVPGEYVMSRDESTGDVTYVEVHDVHDNGDNYVVEYTFEDGTSVTCTPDHKFRTTCGQMLPIREIVTRGLDVVSVDVDEVTTTTAQRIRASRA